MGLILQFQLFESLCDISGHKGDLHKCDFYKSREAGRLLSYVIFSILILLIKIFSLECVYSNYRELLSAGASRSWQDIVRQMTRGRTNRIDAGVILRYFEPLNQWLKRQNQMEPVIGWVTSQEDTGLYNKIVLKKKSFTYRKVSLLFLRLIFVDIPTSVSALFAHWYLSKANTISSWMMITLISVISSYFTL